MVDSGLLFLKTLARRLKFGGSPLPANNQVYGDLKILPVRQHKNSYTHQLCRSALTQHQ